MGLLEELDSLHLTEFGLLLRALREEACLTQEELADRSGVSVRAISDLERGRTKRPHRNSVNLLAEALRIEDDALERFRQMARRKAVATPLGPVRSLMGIDAFPVSKSPSSELSQARVAELIEWMRQVLVEEPARQGNGAGLGWPGPRVVQLVGDSGTEKAAVVVQSSAHFRRYFPDGQFYVNAEAGMPGPAALVGRLSRVFGVEPGRQTSLEHQVSCLRAVLRSRRALLVLDNVVDAAQVRPLLTTDGACAVIVIAQRRLDLFEGVWTVDFRSVGCFDGAALAPVLLKTG